MNNAPQNSNARRARDEQLQALNALAYDVLIRERDGRIHALIPELALAASGKDVQAAHRRLQSHKEDLFGRMIDSGAVDEIPPPRARRDSDRMRLELKTFAIKLALVCVLAVSSLVFAGALLSDKLAGLSVIGIAKRNFNALALEARHFAAAPPDVQRQRTAKLREIARAMAPLLDAFKNTAPPAAQEKR